MHQVRTEMLIQARARLRVTANSRALYQVAPLLKEVSGLDLVGDHGVGGSAATYSATVSPAEAKEAVKKLVRKFQFDFAHKSKYDPPIAQGPKAKAYVSWNKALSNKDAPSWTTRMVVVPDGDNVRIIFRVMNVK
ncbi:hypothetical protein [Achromobacter phage Motura]|uniref:Uncharacterized protein n=1 Tax=Achromobacter phage Motura TaxID=2591403 RepID=A0A514CT16_9CAUD|nr:hypothetical protein H1O15_gp160 [Achromobacter phage Motura]QDH83628.1 hypothetical protein [Achromobacter phage Motura]